MSETVKPHILVVDDDPGIRASLTRFLAANELGVSDAESTQAARRVLKASKVDLVVLDIMMPGQDGLSFCRQLRSEGGPPVVFISALTDDVDRIVGIEMGGDDYLAKPFNPRELLARIKAVMRRAAASAIAPPEGADETFQFAQWTLLAGSRELVRDDGVVVPLGDTEYRLLIILLANPRRVLSRQQLLDKLHGPDAGAVFDRSVDSQISRLREKLGDDAKHPGIIKTAWGAGYILDASVVEKS